MQAANAYFCAGASHHLVLHRYKLWLLADADLLSTRNSYRLCNTGCVATRALLVSCPLVDVSVAHLQPRPQSGPKLPSSRSGDVIDSSGRSASVWQLGGLKRCAATDDPPFPLGPARTGRMG